MTGGTSRERRSLCQQCRHALDPAEVQSLTIRSHSLQAAALMLMVSGPLTEGVLMLISSTAFAKRNTKEKPEMKQKGEDEGVTRSIDRKSKKTKSRPN